MLVGGHGKLIQSATQVPLSSLAAGDKVTAKVLGPTRHGLSVSIGQETFHLTSPSKLGDARTLTLQTTGSSTAGHGEVRILAQDDRPLERPIAARLTAPSTVSPAAADTIVQKGTIEVNVAPLNAQGKVVGPSQSVLLQTATSSAHPQSGLGKPEGIPNTEAALEQSRTVSKQVSEQVRPVSSTPNQGSVGPTVNPPSEETGILPNRAVDPSKPAPQMSSQSVGDTHRQADGVKVVHAEGQALTRTEPRPSLSTSFAASAVSLLSSLKQAVAGSHTRLDAAGPGGAATSPPSSVEQPPSPSAKPSLGTATPSLSAGSSGSSAPSSDAALPTASRIDSRPGHDRGLATTAVVVVRTSGENMVLKAEGQLFKVEQPLDLPLGTTLQATFSSSPVAVAASTQGQGGETRATLLNQLIDILDNIDQASRFRDAEGGSEPKRQLPMPDRHLASNFLNLLHLEDGSVSENDATSSQQQHLLSESQQDKIQGLMRDVRGASMEPVAEGWRSTTLPFGHDQAQAVILYVRDQTLDPEDQSPSQEMEQEDIQRAVFDVSFSQLGRCQIDVLCQGKRFDLLMRNDSVLSAQDQQVISGLFRSACDVAGVTGEVNFKVGDFFEPAPAQAPRRSLMT